MPNAECAVNFWIPKQTKVSTISHRRIASIR